MKPMRVVLITRRFWPLVGGAEMVVANLAAEFRRQGALPTILTAQWDRRWPRELVHREVPVVRLSNPAFRFWGTLRYMAALRRWLRRNRDAFDVAYVSMLKHDAYAALGALRGSHVPVILRAEGAGPTGDMHWQESGNFGSLIRRRCMTADAFVACSPAIREELLAAGYAPERLHSISNGVPLPPPRSQKRRLAARLTLAEIHSSLQLDPPAPLVVYTGRLHEAKGLSDLVAAWATIIPSHPTARLWLVGEGPQRSDLQSQIEARGLNQSIRLPGVFDNVEDMLEAADAFVLPSYVEGMSLAMLEAMAAGLAVVASDIPGNRTLVEHQTHGLLVPTHDPSRLADALRRVLEHPDLAQQLGCAARRRVEAEFSLEQTTRQHLELFAELIGKKSDTA